MFFLLLIQNAFIINFFNFIAFCFSCTKKQSSIETNPSNKQQAIQIYQEGLEAMNEGQYFIAKKNLIDLKLCCPNTMGCKISFDVSYCLYSINSHDESIISLKRFIKTYPADPNIDYANYLIAINYYEQILGTEKDLEPLLLSKISI